LTSYERAQMPQSRPIISQICVVLVFRYLLQLRGAYLLDIYQTSTKRLDLSNSINLISNNIMRLQSIQFVQKIGQRHMSQHVNPLINSSNKSDNLRLSHQLMLLLYQSREISIQLALAYHVQYSQSGQGKVDSMLSRYLLDIY
jgi:hypothetical protein